MKLRSRRRTTETASTDLSTTESVDNDRDSSTDSGIHMDSDTLSSSQDNQDNQDTAFSGLANILLPSMLTRIPSINIENEFDNLRTKHLQGMEKCKYRLQKYGRWVVWPIIFLFVLPTLTSVLFTLVLEPMGIMLPENYYFTLWMQSDLWSVWGFKDAPIAEKGASKVRKIGGKYLEEYCMVLLVWYSKPFFYWLCNWTDIDRSDAKKNRQKLAWTRLNFSLNLLQENKRGEPKITMRTINEDSLPVIFTGMLWHDDCFMPGQRNDVVVRACLWWTVVDCARVGCF